MPSVLSVQSLYEDFKQVSREGFYSIGLHPWYINRQSLEQQFNDLTSHVYSNNVLAIGECGLDKVCATDWQVQIEALKMQIGLANRVNKPLVIHCVRAYEEVLKILRDDHVQVPVIFHGFNKNRQLAEQLIKSEYYLSFGAALLQESAPARDVVAYIPPEKWFLETDDAAISITDIYNAAASIRKTPPDALILQLGKNFETVFKK